MSATTLPLPLKVALLISDSLARAELAQGLVNFGFETCTIDTFAGYGPFADRGGHDFCVLDASRSPAEALSTVARIRASSDAGVVLLTGPEQIETRIHGLLIGADAYLTKPVQTRELAAVMLGIARRLGLHRKAVERIAPSPALVPNIASTPVWTLMDDDSVLLAPGGLRIDLSTAERILIAALAERMGETLSREYIGDLLDRSITRLGEERVEPRAPQRVSMLISRLRKKAARAGLTLPLRVVRGCGYAFSEQIRRQPEVAEAPGEYISDLWCERAEPVTQQAPAGLPKPIG